MTAPKAKISDINVYAGHIFEVALDSQTASTGYSWALSFMPDCVDLLDIRHETSNSAISGGTAKQVFVFAAIKAAHSHIEFKLIRMWDPQQFAKKQTFAIIITDAPQSLEKDLENTIGSCKFVADESKESACPVNTALYMAPIVAKYMSPYPTQNSNVAIPPYGFPLKVVENPENCLLAYGTPDGIAKASEECVLKYGFPVHMLYGIVPKDALGNAAGDQENCNVKYGFPVVKYGIPVMKYGIPVMKYGFPITVEENENCALKYGCPVEIVEDANNCVIPYGAPLAANTAEDNCVLKYGFPVEIQENLDSCIVKYGIPTGIAADSESCVLKYGFPVKSAHDENNCLVKYGAPVAPQSEESEK